MANAIAWTSLAVSLSVGAFTVWIYLLRYRREHYPRVLVFARGVTGFEEDGVGIFGHAMEVRIVNVGLRAVEISQMHTQVKGLGVRWLRDAGGNVGLMLQPGESKEWIEPLGPHHRKLKEELGQERRFIIRAVATTSDNRVFISRWKRMEHMDQSFTWRLKWGNRMRRLREPFRRKPQIWN